MKLSEAIRLGAATTQQAFGAFTDGKGGACALGAAFCAAGQLDISSPLHGVNPCDFETMAIEAGWGHLIGLCLPSEEIQDIDCPAGCRPAGLTLFGGQAIAHLNDAHRWSREAIADWYELNFEMPDDPRSTQAETVAELKEI